MSAAYKRILLKLSGEALMGDDAYGINEDVVTRIVSEIAEITRLGVQVGVVIGGGNIFRGMKGAASGMDRATADYMGMLATVMNAMALADAMRRMDVPARVQSALRGAEIGAQIVLKATKVDGVYTADPKKDPQAQRYHRISFDEAIGRNLAVLDATAFALCRDQKLPINVFSIFKAGALKRVVMGEDEGTLVHS